MLTPHEQLVETVLHELKYRVWNSVDHQLSHVENNCLGPSFETPSNVVLHFQDITLTLRLFPQATQ